jgi:hypothetical protein
LTSAVLYESALTRPGHQRRSDRLQLHQQQRVPYPYRHHNQQPMSEDDDEGSYQALSVVYQDKSGLFFLERENVVFALMSVVVCVLIEFKCRLVGVT